jgi:NitT/TauT family transport system permease protein
MNHESAKSIEDLDLDLDEGVIDEPVHGGVSRNSTDTADADAKDPSVRKTSTTARRQIRLPDLRSKLKSLPWGSLAIGTIAVLGALILWQVLSYYQVNFVLSFQNIPTPAVVGEQFIKLLGTAEFYHHIGVSLERIAIAFSLASVLGVLIGIFMGRSRIFAGIMMPYIEILRPIPAVAWIPLAILMMPTEESSIIYITFLGAFFPVVLNTVHGVEQTSESLVRAAESLGAGKRSIMWHVILPGALPSIMAGLAIGMGVAWFSLLAGEIISGQYGIGYFTWNSYTLVQYPNIIIGMLTIGGLGTLSTWLVKKASVPALRWQEHKD